MRIKPSVVLGCTALCAGAGVAVIVIVHDPAYASASVIGLFWVASLLMLWGGVAALFSLAGQRLAYALSNGLFWATALVALGMLSQRSAANLRLSGAIIGATIALSFVLWLRSRRHQNTHV